jgi:hypothetical protein
MRQTIAFNNNSNSWVSRYSYTSSCFGWIKDIMVSAPVFTSTQQVLWKHDGNASSNCSFYGCEPVPAGVSFAFNSNPSANKIYKAFSVETPNLNTLDRSAVNTFVVNDQTNSSGTFKAITVNALKNKGGMLYGGIKGVAQEKSNTRVIPVGIVEYVVPGEEFESFFGVGPSSQGEGAYIKISGPSSQYSGGIAYLCRPEEAYALALDTSIDATAAQISYQYEGGYFVSGTTSLTTGDEVVIAYRNIGQDMAKGQYADVSVSFQTDSDFEVHAFNVDFEQTTLDHNS